MFFYTYVSKVLPEVSIKKFFKVKIDTNTSSKNQKIKLKICELSSIIGGMNKKRAKEKTKFIVFGICTISGFRMHVTDSLKNSLRN